MSDCYTDEFVTRMVFCMGQSPGNYREYIVECYDSVISGGMKAPDEDKDIIIETVCRLLRGT
jgi:hypothetical protein